MTRWNIISGCFDAANALGAHLLVMHGLKPGASIEEPEYFERFGALVQLGRAQGIMVAQENVVQFSSQSPVFLARMRKALGNDFHMVLDLKQAVRSGLDRSSLRGNLPAKSSMSMSAITCPAGIACPPGEGAFRFNALAALLEDAGYQGSFMIELYAGNFTDDKQLMRAKAYLEKQQG